MVLRVNPNDPLVQQQMARSNAAATTISPMIQQRQQLEQGVNRLQNPMMSPEELLLATNRSRDLANIQNISAQQQMNNPQPQQVMRTTGGGSGAITGGAGGGISRPVTNRAPMNTGQPSLSAQDEMAALQLRANKQQLNTPRVQQAGMSQLPEQGMLGKKPTMGGNTGPAQQTNLGSGGPNYLQNRTGGNVDPAGQYLNVTNRDALDAFSQAINAGPSRFAREASGNLREGMGLNLDASAEVMALMRGGGLGGINRGIERDFADEVMSSINRSSEAAGANAGVLGSYLRNDANERMQEMKARVGMDAVLGGGQSMAGLNNALANMAANGDPIANELIRYLTVGAQLDETLSPEDLERFNRGRR